MEDFGQNLRKIRQKANDQRRQREAEEQSQAQRDREQARRVDEAAVGIEAHVEQRLREFMEQFVEFRFDAHLDKGRHLRVVWDDPAEGRSRLHQLSFSVRRYHEYADVEVEVKMIIANAEKHRRLGEEDVFEGNPDNLKDFIDQQIYRFTQLYVEGRGW